MEIYSIRDITQNQYMRPMTMVNHGDATRQFTEIVNNTDANNLISKYPEQFELMHLGSFDSDDGTIQPIRPTQIGTAAAFKRT